MSAGGEYGYDGGFGARLFARARGRLSSENGTSRGPGASGEPQRRLRRGPAWGPVSRRGRWRRSQAFKVLSALLVGTAAWVVAAAVVPTPVDPGVPVVVVSRDVGVGRSLAREDLRVEPRAAGLLPRGVLSDVDAAVGRVLSAPVVAGEVLTSVRFRGPPQLSGLSPGHLAVDLPVAVSPLVSNLRPGDTVSVIVGGTGQIVADAAVVLAADQPEPGVLGAGDRGADVLVAVTADEAKAVAVAMAPPGPQSAAGGFVVALRP